MGNMEICANSNFETLLQNQQNGLYRSVLKCPSGHWLALFETLGCSQCGSKNLCEANISCIECSYGLCSLCFSRKFNKWERQVNRIDPLKAESLKQTLRKELREFISSDRAGVETQSLQRLQIFLFRESSKNYDFRTEKQVSLKSSLEARIQKITVLCQKVYTQRALTLSKA